MFVDSIRMRDIIILISIFLLLNLVSMISTAAIESSSPISEQHRSYEYYGYVPWHPAGIGVVGFNDSTHVVIYDLTDGSVLAEAVVNRMESKRWNITQQLISLGKTPGRLLFKIVADKRIGAFIVGGSMMFAELAWVGGGTGATFYPSTTGGYVGKEFIYVSLPTIAIYSEHYDYVIALEDAEVRVYDDSGKQVGETLKLWQNETASISTMGQSIYRIVSTGYIAVCTIGYDQFMAVPSTTGGFSGRSFKTIVNAVSYTHLTLPTN